MVFLLFWPVFDEHVLPLPSLLLTVGPWSFYNKNKNDIKSLQILRFTSDTSGFTLCTFPTVNHTIFIDLAPFTKVDCSSKSFIGNIWAKTVDTGTFSWKKTCSKTIMCYMIWWLIVKQNNAAEWFHADSQSGVFKYVNFYQTGQTGNLICSSSTSWMAGFGSFSLWVRTTEFIWLLLAFLELLVRHSVT